MQNSSQDTLIAVQKYLRYKCIVISYTYAIKIRI